MTSWKVIGVAVLALPFGIVGGILAAWARARWFVERPRWVASGAGLRPVPTNKELDAAVHAHPANALPEWPEAELALAPADGAPAVAVRVGDVVRLETTAGSVAVTVTAVVRRLSNAGDAYEQYVGEGRFGERRYRVQFRCWHIHEVVVRSVPMFYPPNENRLDNQGRL